jgi:hypothetical protein
MAKFEIRKNSKISQPYHFVLIANNGQIVLTSENYTTKQNAKNGIETIKSLVSSAAIVDNTGEQQSFSASLLGKF